MIFICPVCKKDYDDTDFEEVPDCDDIKEEGMCSGCLSSL